MTNGELQAVLKIKSEGRGKDNDLRVNNTKMVVQAIDMDENKNRR